MCRAQCKCPDAVHEIESINAVAAIVLERTACAELVKSALGVFKPGSREWEWSQRLAQAISQRRTQP